MRMIFFLLCCAPLIYVAYLMLSVIFLGGGGAPR